MNILLMVLAIVYAIIGVVSVKNIVKVNKENTEVKKDYINARGTVMKLTNDYAEVKELLHDMKSGYDVLTAQVQQLTYNNETLTQSLGEAFERVSSLEYDNSIIKQKLHIYNRLSPHLVVKESFKTTM